jgi:hypothetical protein
MACWATIEEAGPQACLCEGSRREKRNPDRCVAQMVNGSTLFLFSCQRSDVSNGHPGDQDCG